MGDCTKSRRKGSKVSSKENKAIVSKFGFSRLETHVAVDFEEIENVANLEANLTQAQEWAEFVLKEAGLPTDPHQRIWAKSRNKWREVPSELTAEEFRSQAKKGEQPKKANWLVEDRKLTAAWFAMQVLSNIQLTRSWATKSNADSAAHFAFRVGYYWMKGVYEHDLINSARRKGGAVQPEKPWREIAHWAKSEWPDKTPKEIWESLPETSRDTPNIGKWIVQRDGDRLLAKDDTEGKDFECAFNTFRHYLYKSK